MYNSSAFNLGTGFIRLGGGVLSVAILSRTWSQSDFGSWAFVTAITSTSAALDFGLSIYAGSLSKENSQGENYEQKINSILILAVVVAGLASSLLVLLAPWLAAFIHEEESQLVVADAISGCAFGLAGGKMLAGVASAILISQNRYRDLALISAGQVLTVLGVNLATTLTQSTFNLNLALQSYATAGWAVIILVVIRYCAVQVGGREAKIAARANISSLIDTVKKSLSLFASSLSSICFSNVDKLIVGSALGSKNLAFYTIASLVAGQINSLSALLVQPIIHIVPKVDSNKQAALSLEKYANISIIAGPSLGLSLILLSPIVRSIFFPSLHDQNQIYFAEQSIALMCFIYGIYSTNCYGYYYLLSKQVFKFISIVVSISTALVLLGMTVMGNSFGLLGLVACNAAYIISCSLTIVALKGQEKNYRVAFYAFVSISMVSMACIASKYLMFTRA
jgi:O-antigen/teichoic acid export membrane protein